MLRLASSSTPAPSALVLVGPAAATADGQLAYDGDTTPAWLAQVLDAQATAKVRELNDLELDRLLIGQIQHAARRLAHKNAATDSLDVNMMARDLASVLRLSWGYLTKGEIEQVFRLGSMGQLPPRDKDGDPVEEVIYLSSKTMGIWLRRYKYDVKTKAMAHAQRLAYQASELPNDHPAFAAWRIARLVHLYHLPPVCLRHLSQREGDFKNLLYQWLKDIGALGFKPKPTDFWARLEALDKSKLRRAGQYPKDEAWLAMATGKRETYTERLTAAKRWRTLCLWLTGHRQRDTDLAALLWPLALAAYKVPAAEHADTLKSAA
jgi:hypothetical protein